MIEENLPGGAYRQKIYEMIQDTIGRTLTTNEHNALRMVLKAYANAHTTHVGVVQQEAKTHIFICAKCDSSISGKGRNFFKARKGRVVKEEKTDA